MDLFWEEGFDGTSLDALEASTGLNRSSLYNTFGGKLEIFGRALDAYRAGPCVMMERPLREGRGGEALAGYFEELRAFVLSPNSHRGCLMVNTALESDLDASSRRHVQAHFDRLRDLLARAYETGLEDGSVDCTLDLEEATDWLVTFVRGVLTSAAAGEDGRRLERSLHAAAKQLGIGSA